MKTQYDEQETITKAALSDHLESWIESFLIDRKAQNFTPGTLHTYRAKFRLWLTFCDTQVISRVGQVTPDTIRRWLLWLEETDHNPGGIHACYTVLRAFLRWYWEETDQEGNPPISKVKAPKRTLAPLEPADLKDVERLLRTCGADLVGLRDRALMLTLLDTGVRASECCSIDVEDVDLQSGAVLIRMGKGRKPRTTFLSQTTRRAVRAYLKARNDNNPALWHSDKADRLTYWGLRLMVERRSKLAGIDHPTLHSFRRAFALEMLRGGVDVYSLQELMGHADLQVLRRYLKQDTDDLRAAHSKGSPVERMRSKK